MDSCPTPPEGAEAARAKLRRWYGTVGHAHLSVLRWYRCVGYARHDGVSVDMDAPPGLSWGHGAQDIEYLPGGPCMVDGQPMTDEQRRDVQRLLLQVSTDARDALAGYSTLAVVLT